MCTGLRPWSIGLINHNTAVSPWQIIGQGARRRTRTSFWAGVLARRPYQIARSAALVLGSSGLKAWIIIYLLVTTLGCKHQSGPNKHRS